MAAVQPSSHRVRCRLLARISARSSRSRLMGDNACADKRVCCKAADGLWRCLETFGDDAARLVLFVGVVRLPARRCPVAETPVIIM